MQIAILLFDQLTALDAVGPYETLSRVPGAEVTFVATEARPYRTDTGSLALLADATLDELAHPEIVVVPGGPGEAGARDDAATLDWLRAAHETSRWTTSVCTGSLVLAAAGLLDGRRATSHWSALGALRALGAEAVSERVVVDGRIITAAGVSAGIDMGLTLAATLAGDVVAEAIQLGIEYDPQPPFDRGAVHKARPEVVELLRSTSRFTADV
jgi:putative intracellular protease/amidase